MYQFQEMRAVIHSFFGTMHKRTPTQNHAWFKIALSALEKAVKSYEYQIESWEGAPNFEERTVVISKMQSKYIGLLNQVQSEYTQFMHRYADELKAA